MAGSDELPDPEWTELSDLGPPILGRLHGGEPANDGVDHFYTCAECGQSVDTRDLRQVMWHEVPGHSRIEAEPAPASCSLGEPDSTRN
ncbi:hypothetical protein FJ948_21815 [Mesorhizobium sp. B2-3-12]|nr:hypothetical protein FJ948_21815 [Mesorhizobium sp. B2-3-12]